MGIFAGIGVFLAAMYAMVQALLLEGRARWINVALFVLILIVMGALMERHVGLARVLAVPLFMVAAWAFTLEPRWYKIFPILVMVFSVILMLGHVALTPLPR